MGVKGFINHAHSAQRPIMLHRRGRVGNPRELLATRATILWLAQMSPHLIKRYCPPEAITCQSNTGNKASRNVIKHE